jgi:hypothetical protein
VNVEYPDMPWPVDSRTKFTARIHGLKAVALRLFNL